MKKYVLFIFTFLLFLPFHIYAQTQMQTKNEKVDYPWVPRISAYEAYIKYKDGKVIILSAGGEAFSRRHIMGALDFNVKPRDHLINKLPKHGIEIFTY